MSIGKKLGIIAAGTVMCFTALAPISARADSLQTDKNTYRNLALVSGAVALYGIANHNQAAAALGTVGAVIAGSQYERDQRLQCNGGYYWQGGGYAYRGGYDGRFNHDYYQHYTVHYGRHFRGAR